MVHENGCKEHRYSFVLNVNPDDNEEPVSPRGYEVNQVSWFSYKWYENVYAVGPIILIISLLFGVAFYVVYDGWDLSTSFFFATQALLGVMYGVPLQPHSLSEIFTLCYYLYGSTLIAGAIGAFAGHLVTTAPQIAADERRRMFERASLEDVDGDGFIGVHDFVRYMQNNIGYLIGWEDHRTKYLTVLAALGWILIGCIYGMLYERWSFQTSFFFCLSAMAQAGAPAPPCDGGDAYTCELGTFRGYAMGVFLIVGCPLFALCMGQFAGLMVERAIRVKERRILHRPLTEEEYKYAANLYKSDEVLDLGEFTILELLRLERVTLDDLRLIKELFQKIDYNYSGIIDKPMLRKSKLMERGYGSFDDANLLERRDTIKSALPRVKSLPDMDELENTHVEDEALTSRLGASNHDDEDYYSCDESYFNRGTSIRRMSLGEYNDVVVSMTVAAAEED